MVYNNIKLLLIIDGKQRKANKQYIKNGKIPGKIVKESGRGFPYLVHLPNL